MIYLRDSNASSSVDVSPEHSCEATYPSYLEWQGPPPSKTGSSGASVRTCAERNALYAEFAPLVRRLIRQYGENAELRQDLEGEIYCRFCALLEAYDPERGVPLRPYLVRQLTASIYTYARYHWRLQKRESPWQTDESMREPLSPQDPTPGWVEGLSRQQLTVRLPEALLQLPARQRQVVIWRYYEERSFEEIAQLLQIQPATARSLLRHGLNNLRRHMGCIEGADAAP